MASSSQKEIDSTKQVMLLLADDGALRRDPSLSSVLVDDFFAHGQAQSPPWGRRRLRVETAVKWSKGRFLLARRNEAHVVNEKESMNRGRTQVHVDHGRWRE